MQIAPLTIYHATFLRQAIAAVKRHFLVQRMAFDNIFYEFGNSVPFVSTSRGNEYVFLLLLNHPLTLNID